MSNIDEFEFEKVENGYSIKAFRSDDENVIVPDTFDGEPVVEISNNAFKNNKIIKNVTLSNSIVKIGEYAFFRCLALETISLPDDLVLIQEKAFYQCKNLKEIVWNDNLKHIEVAAFSTCESLEKIVFPKNLETIGHFAFINCTNLREIYFNAKLTLINYSFVQCYNLEVVEFAHNDDELQNLKIIEDSIEFNEKLKNRPCFLVKTFSQSPQIMYNLFMLTNFNDLSCDEQDEYLEILKVCDYMKDSKHLLYLILEHNNISAVSLFIKLGFRLDLNDLDDWIENSINENKIEITAMLIKYKNDTFDQEFIQQNKTRNEMIEIGLEPYTFTELQRKWVAVNSNDCITIAGYNGENKSAIIPAKIDTGVPIWYVGRGNYGCLEEVVLSEGIVEILERAFFNFTLTSEILTECKINKITLPNSLTKMGYQCFRSSDITEIILPDLIEVIPDSAFYSCNYLKKIKFPANLKVIDKSAFHWCSKIEELVLPDKLEVINSKAFLQTSLTEITIPASVVKIGDRAFERCSNLVKVILESSDTDCHTDAFFECTKLEFVGVDGGENIINQFYLGLY